MLNKFFLKESLMIFTIICILTTLIIITYSDYTLNTKKNSSLKNHINVVNFIEKSFIKCINGEKLVLKQSLTTNTEDFCSTVILANALKIREALVNHFNALEWCNAYELMNSPDNCMPAVVEGSYMEKGNFGETLLLVSKNSLIVHTKISSSKNITNNINFK